MSPHEGPGLGVQGWKAGQASQAAQTKCLVMGTNEQLCSKREAEVSDMSRSPEDQTYSCAHFSLKEAVSGPLQVIVQGLALEHRPPDVRELNGLDCFVVLTAGASGKPG